MKQKRFDKIGTHGKCDFESEFLEMVFRVVEEIIIFMNEIESSNLKKNYVEIYFRQTMVVLYGKVNFCEIIPFSGWLSRICTW